MSLFTYQKLSHLWQHRKHWTVESYQSCEGFPHRC